MYLELLQKKKIQKPTEATGDLIDNKLVLKLRKSQEFHHRIVQRQPQTNQIYRKKDIYLQKKDDLRLI